jgi:hypothetical protein
MLAKNVSDDDHAGAARKRTGIERAVIAFAIIEALVIMAVIIYRVMR